MRMCDILLCVCIYMFVGFVYVLEFVNIYVFGWLIWMFVFYGISTFVGYLMPNPFYFK